MGRGRDGDGGGGGLLLLVASWGSSSATGDLIIKRLDVLEDESTTAIGETEDERTDRCLFFRRFDCIMVLPAPFCIGGPKDGGGVPCLCELGGRSSSISSGLDLLTLNV